MKLFFKHNDRYSRSYFLIDSKYLAISITFRTVEDIYSEMHGIMSTINLTLFTFEFMIGGIMWDGIL